MTDDAIQSTPLYTYEVDKLGRTTKATAKYLPGGDRPIDYVYDARGDRTSMTLTDGSETLAHVYGYAADSALLSSATFPSSGTALTITRWPHDGVKVITYAGGVHRDVTYDSRGPIASIQIFPPSGSTPLESWTYTYTDLLNVDTITDQASRVTDYGYDNLDRLTSADHPAMPAPLNTLPDLETFTYDGLGNRTMSGYAHDANHRMRASPSKTYDYDDDGNLKVRDRCPARPAIPGTSRTSSLAIRAGLRLRTTCTTRSGGESIKRSGPRRNGSCGMDCRSWRNSTGAERDSGVVKILDHGSMGN